MTKDGFSYESSGILINFKNTHNQAELSRFENDVAHIKATYLKVGEGIAGVFDAEHLKKFHKALFQEIYPWAGETRANRGGFQGVKDTMVNNLPQEMQFAPFREIENRLNAISLQLKKENFLKGLEAETFSQRAAYFLDQYNHVHPFREGNGRTLQALFTQLGKEAGYDVNFHRADPAAFNEARNYALVKPHPPHESPKNLAPLHHFLREVITPLPILAVDTSLENAPQIKTASSAALRRIEVLRELEVTGSRIGERWDILVKQQVKEIVEDPRKLKSYEKHLRTVGKSILEGGANPGHYLYQDAERFTQALDQVRLLAAGKEIPSQGTAPHQKEREPPKNHKEAQDLFVRVAAVVSRALQDHGKAEEGRGLREVGTFVARVPYIGGANKENVQLALEASKTLPSLPGKDPLGDLQRALQVLEKPAQRQPQERQSASQRLRNRELER